MKEDLTFDTIPAWFCGMVEEYRLELAKKNPNLQLDVSLDWYTMCWIHETVLISKNFWFIKWLVDKDKVDWNFIDYAEIHQTKRELESNYEPNDIEKQYYERLLMLLSIQDDPIDFLISVLR